MAPEIAARALAALATIRAMRPIFKDKGLSVATRTNALVSHVDAKIFYSASVWPVIPLKSLRRLEAVRATAMRDIGGFSRVDHLMSDEELRMQLKVPSVRARIVVQRLRYFARVLACAPSQLLALLQQDATGWKAQLQNDMAVMWIHLGCRLRDLPDPRIAPGPWEQFVFRWPHQWKLLVRSFESVLASCGDDCFDAAVPISRALALQGVQDRRLAACLLRMFGAAAVHDGVPAGEPPLDVGCGLSFCALCRKWFGSSVAYKRHLWKAHGERFRLRVYVADGMCPVCHACFWSRQRAIRHLARPKSKCAVALQYGGVQELPEDVVCILDEEDAVANRSARILGRGVAEATRPFVPAY